MGVTNVHHEIANCAKKPNLRPMSPCDKREVSSVVLRSANESHDPAGAYLAFVLAEHDRLSTDHASDTFSSDDYEVDRLRLSPSTSGRVRDRAGGAVSASDLSAWLRRMWE